MFTEFSINEQILWYSPTTMRWRKGRIIDKNPNGITILTRPEKYKIEVIIDNPDNIKKI